MNKKQLLKVKKAMNFENVPEQKKLLRQIKKQYTHLDNKDKPQFLIEVEDFFSKRNSK
jgi:hypothetical protein